MISRRLVACGIVGVFVGSAPLVPARGAAAEKVVIGVVGSAGPLYWPLYIGVQKGYFTAENLAIDLTYVQSSAGVIQQLAAHSIDLTVGVGLVDPIRAIDNGAPIAIVRVIVQAPPYVLLAQRSINSIKELKGKTISIGGPKDITRIYLDRMLEPNGIQEKDVDLVFAGSTAARYSALQSGAIHATFLTAPFNFYAVAAGFRDIGRTDDYIKDLPFLGAAIHVGWANANRSVVQNFLAAFDKAVMFFEDPRNREEAVNIMVVAGNMKREDIELSYDFFRDGRFFDPRSGVSKAKLGNLVDAMRQLGEIQGQLDVNRLIAPGVTQVND